MPRPCSRVVALLPAAGLVLLAAAGCSKPLEPIQVAGGNILVRNQTTQGWRQVTIFLNDWYSAGAHEIPAGGFVNPAASSFQDAYGRRFDPARASMLSVVVKATDAAGQPVRLTWGRAGLR